MEIDSDGDGDDEKIVLNADDLANVDMSELTNTDRRMLRAVTQAKKATDQMRVCYGLADQFIEFIAEENNSGLVLERLKNCTVHIYGRIHDLRILHATNCTVELTAPPLSECVISRCQRLTLSIGHGDADVQVREPRAVQCMFSTAVQLTILVPFSLHITTCWEMYYRLNAQHDFCPCPVNPFSSQCQLTFPAEYF